MSDWKLVPVEPTKDQTIAGFECDAFDRLSTACNENGGWPYSCREAAEFVRDIYHAMLAATPSPSDCTRSHPHEQMDKLCELRTEIARLTNKLANLTATPAAHVPADEQLRKTANALANAVIGLSIAEAEVRAAIGNINYGVLLHWRDEVKAALKAAPPAAYVPAGELRELVEEWEKLAGECKGADIVILLDALQVLLNRHCKPEAGEDV